MFLQVSTQLTEMQELFDEVLRAKSVHCCVHVFVACCILHTGGVLDPSS